MKKAKAGDIDAVTESVKVLEKLEKLQKQLEKFEGQMNESQIKRMAKIVAKIATAL